MEYNFTLVIENLFLSFSSVVCEGDWEKGIQCFEEDLCVPWEGVCDGTQVCGIEKREDCVNSTKANDRAQEVQEGTDRENCDGDEYEYMCPMKNYIPQSKCCLQFQRITI